jgi:hypothetical protein
MTLKFVLPKSKFSEKYFSLIFSQIERAISFSNNLFAWQMERHWNWETRSNCKMSVRRNDEK